MIGSELDAAGIPIRTARGLPALPRAQRPHGRTFFLATRLLAPRQRPAVHALYGFARRADDILDDFDARGTEPRAEQLQALSTQLFNCLVEDQARDGDPTLAAVVAHRTQVRHRMGPLRRLPGLDADGPDGHRLPDRAALERYMYGSAEVIGLQLLPILGTVGAARRRRTARGGAGKGVPAHQLHQRCRRGSRAVAGSTCPPTSSPPIGVDRELLSWCQTNRRTDPRVRRALIDQDAAARRVYAVARQGIEMLAPASRPCVAAALTLYSEILERIEEIDFEIFGQRATVGKVRRLAVAGNGIVQSWSARLTAWESVSVDRWHYLIVLGACLLITAPLEMFGRGVYRQPRRLLGALVPVVAVFLVWDLIAIIAGVWWYNPRYILGVKLPGDVPLEEVLFFLVVPLCGLLTYSAVDSILSMVSRRRTRIKQR